MAVVVVDWLTVLVSLGASIAAGLATAYIGVRYFTGPRIRAEHAAAAHRHIRDLASDLRRDLRGFRAHTTSSLRRDGSAHADDGDLAQRLLRISHDLPWWSRRRVERRLDVIFGSGWMRLARLRDKSTPDEAQLSSRASLAQALFRSGLDGDKTPPNYVDGLLHRAYHAGPNSIEVSQLEKHLLQLERSR